MNKTLMRTMVATMIATSGIAAVGTGVANADMPCQKRNTHQAFKQWGDSAQYFLAENGDFERSSDGWTLKNATRVNYQAPWRVNGSNHVKALRIKPGGSATVRMCVTEVEDVMRFFYRTPHGGGSLRTTIDAATTRGWGRSSWGMWSSSKAWGVSPKVNIPSVRDGDGRVWITIKFENTGSNNILIDDVMIDPWVAR